MAYAVYKTESFGKEVEKLSESDQDIIQNMLVKLAENPYVGDMIKYKFFREKRIREKRIYFLVYDDLSMVLAVAFGGKKAQQETIDEIIMCLPEFRKYAENLAR